MQPDPYAGIHHCGIHEEGTKRHLVLVDAYEHEAKATHGRHSHPTRRHKTQRRQMRMPCARAAHRRGRRRGMGQQEDNLRIRKEGSEVETVSSGLKFEGGTDLSTEAPMDNGRPDLARAKQPE